MHFVLNERGTVTGMVIDTIEFQLRGVRKISQSWIGNRSLHFFKSGIEFHTIESAIPSFFPASCRTVCSSSVGGSVKTADRVAEGVASLHARNSTSSGRDHSQSERLNVQKQTTRYNMRAGLPEIGLHTEVKFNSRFLGRPRCVCVEPQYRSQLWQSG